MRIKPGVDWHGLAGERLKEKMNAVGPDVVGIGNIFTCEWQNAAHCARMAKDVSRDIIVVLGGHHPSFEAEFMLRNSCADYIVTGEGELPFLRLLESLRLDPGKRPEGIGGLAFLENGGFVHTGKADAVAELDSLDGPMFELLDPPAYGPETNHCGGVIEGSSALMDLAISRGCPNACNYCTTSAMWGRKIRAFSPERVRSQVRKIAELGFDHVCVEDDHVLLLPEDSRSALFDELKKAGIPWCIDAGTYYPLLTDDFVKAAARAGCYKIAVSFEHPALEIMHAENKYHALETQKQVREKTKEACATLRRHGMQFYAAMMVGFRNETYDTLNLVWDHAKFIVDLGAQFATFFYWKPLPGTVDYMQHYHLVPEQDKWQKCPEKWVLVSPVIKPDRLSVAEMMEFVDRMSLDVNGHPNTLINPKWK